MKTGRIHQPRATNLEQQPSKSIIRGFDGRRSLSLRAKNSPATALFPRLGWSYDHALRREEERQPGPHAPVGPALRLGRIVASANDPAH